MGKEGLFLSMDMSYFLKKFNMKKIAFLAVVIIFICQGIGYGIGESKDLLRPVMRFNKLSKGQEKNLQLTAEEVFSTIGLNKDGEYSEQSWLNPLLAARMIDELGIGIEDKVLCVGPGEVFIHPLACAIRGADLDIVQPNGIDTKNLFIEINDYRRQDAMEKFDRDVIIGKIDAESYHGRVEDAGIPQRHYSYVFLLNVIEDIYDDDLKTKAVEAILSSLKDEATILISTRPTTSGERAKKIFLSKSALLLDDEVIPKTLDYDIVLGRAFREVDSEYTSHVYELKVTRKNKETLSSAIQKDVDVFNNLKVFGDITRKSLDSVLAQIQKNHARFYRTLHDKAITKSKSDNQLFSKDYLIYFLMKEIMNHPEILKNASKKTGLIFKEPKYTGPSPMSWDAQEDFFKTIKNFLERNFHRGYLKGKFIFEPGAGTGRLIPYFSKAGANMFAVDFREDLADRKRHIYHADAEDTPFIDGIFDITADPSIFWHEVTYSQKADRIIKELWRISKPGSYHFYYTNSDEENADLIREFTKLGFKHVKAKTHHALIFRKPEETLDKKLDSIVEPVDL